MLVLVLVAHIMLFFILPFRRQEKAFKGKFYDVQTQTLRMLGQHGDWLRAVFVNFGFSENVDQWLRAILIGVKSDLSYLTSRCVCQHGVSFCNKNGKNTTR